MRRDVRTPIVIGVIAVVLGSWLLAYVVTEDQEQGPMPMPNVTVQLPTE
jgi:hypothetical protein